MILKYIVITYKFTRTMNMTSFKWKRGIILASVSSAPQMTDDKTSLEDQQKACQQWCDDNGITVVDTLIVPGLSRYESDIVDLLEDYREREMQTYEELKRHWRAKDFDVLVCWNDSRIGRSKTLYTYVVENVIRSGRVIFRITGGWIDESNVDMALAMGGIAATTSVTQLVKGRKNGMKNLARRGLPTTSGVPITHKLIRALNGKAERLEVNEDKRRLFNDISTLILEGLGWRHLEQELFLRFGHTNERGEQFSSNRIYSLFTNPTVWGNSAMYHRLDHKLAPVGEWIFEEGHEIPEGVEIYYGTHEAVWTGEEAERLKAEFRRRQQILGKRSPRYTYDFSGLLICGNCGYSLNTVYSLHWRGFACRTTYAMHKVRIKCDYKKSISQKTLQAWFDRMLRKIIEQENWEDLIEDASKTQVNEPTIEQLARKIAKIEAKIAQMINDMALEQSTNLRELYRKQIALADKELGSLKQQVRQLEHRNALSSHQNYERNAAMQKVKAISLERFWQLEGREINQILRRLLGNKRVVVLNGEIIGVADAPVHYRKRKSEPKP